MSKEIYVYSTLSNDNYYTSYKTGGGHIPIVISKILIKGGANIAGKPPHLITPKGVVTKITEEQLNELKQNKVFQMHVDNGFITFEAKKVNPEKVAKNMTEKDQSAPKTPKDLPTNPSFEASIKSPKEAGVSPV